MFPNIATQLSKNPNPFRSRSPLSKYLCITYISVILFEIGVPVANTTPLPFCIPDKYLHFQSISIDLFDDVVDNPATLDNFVVIIQFLNICASSTNI